MTEDGLKLTVYFGERDRAGRRFLADALIDVFARRRLRSSLVMRGISGFGIKHHLRTDRLLTFSEDLPLAAVAVDRREPIEAAAAEITALGFDGLVTLERALLVDGPVAVPWRDRVAGKLTVYLGRHERIDGRLAYEKVVACLHGRGVEGASVLLGVDGTLAGERRRASFLGRNVSVPLMVIAVGASDRIAGALADVSELLPRPLVTLERVSVCKRDGRLLRTPHELPDGDAGGLATWQKLMVYTSERAQHGGTPLHRALVTELRAAGAAGATCLRGIWGYHGDHAPHGDAFLQLHRRVPVVTIVVDTPSRTLRWFEIVDRLTAQTGLVTSELVPAFRATGAGAPRGGLRLAPPHA